MLTLDIQSSSEDGLQSAFKFSDVYVTKMALGGTTKPVYVNSGANELPGNYTEKDNKMVKTLVILIGQLMIHRFPVSVC